MEAAIKTLIFVRRHGETSALISFAFVEGVAAVVCQRLGL